MLKRRYLALLPFVCSSLPAAANPRPRGNGDGEWNRRLLLEPQHNVMQMGGDFANNPAAAQFIDKMVAKHGFDRQQLQEILSQAKRLDYVLRLMDRQAPTGLPPTGPTGAWLRYKKQFITRIMCRTAWCSGISIRTRLTALIRFTACRRKSSSALSAWRLAGAG